MSALRRVIAVCEWKPLPILKHAHVLIPPSQRAPEKVHGPLRSLVFFFLIRST